MLIGWENLDFERAYRTVFSVRCVTCFDCAATTPGVGCQWMSNYTQCGPCASKTICPVCKIKYNTNDLMIQCAHCDRYMKIIIIVDTRH